jgi:hypothetical protein
MIVSVISGLGRDPSLPVCNSPDTLASSAGLLDEIMGDNNGGLFRHEGDLELAKYGSVHFDFDPQRTPSARLRCLDLPVVTIRCGRRSHGRWHQEACVT